MTVLVTGGMGYIGSHTCVELLKQGMEVVIVDNLVNSSAEAGRRVEQITDKNVTFYQIDVRDREKLDEVFRRHKIDCVIHFAGLKAVGESVRMPLEYYDNNLNSTIVLVQTMRRHNVTAGQSTSASRCCATASWPTPAGRWCCCATSTPSARTRAA